VLAVIESHSNEQDYEVIEEKPLGLKDGQEVIVRTPDGKLVKARLATGTEGWKVARLTVRKANDD
jgi:hypothetical protein